MIVIYCYLSCKRWASHTMTSWMRHPHACINKLDSHKCTSFLLTNTKTLLMRIYDVIVSWIWVQNAVHEMNEVKKERRRQIFLHKQIYLGGKQLKFVNFSPWFFVLDAYRVDFQWNFPRKISTNIIMSVGRDTFFLGWCVVLSLPDIWMWDSYPG